MLTSHEPYRCAPERTTREKLGLMHYHATGLRRKGGGVRGRTLRARQDKEHLSSAQADYERLIKERAESPRASEST